MVGVDRRLACLVCTLAWTTLGGAQGGCAPRARAQSAESAESADPEPKPPAGATEEPTSDVSGLAALDPLERARAVSALGDALVLEQLDSGPTPGRIDAALALSAIRSSPWLAEPSAAIPLLIVHMKGRDPDLAPAAARAAVEIARRLVERPRRLEGLLADQVAAWISKLGAIEADARVRSDIRLAAVEAAALLAAARELL